MPTNASIFRRIRDDRSAVTAVEYGLVLTLIAGTAMAGLQIAGSSLSDVFLNYVAGP